MISRDYLGNASLYTQIVRKSDGSFLNATNSKELRAGEILLIPNRNNPNPVPISPSDPVIPTDPSTDPNKKSDSNYMLWLGLGALILIMMNSKKSRKKK
jgi:hypothetical protein